jgi:prolipoprotein diacylglyceryltransferase
VILFYGLLYAIARFVIEFFRDDPRGDVLGLTSMTGLSTSQILSLIVGIAAIVMLVIKWRAAATGVANVPAGADVANA